MGMKTPEMGFQIALQKGMKQVAKWSSMFEIQEYKIESDGI